MFQGELRNIIVKARVDPTLNNGRDTESGTGSVVNPSSECTLGTTRLWQRFDTAVMYILLLATIINVGADTTAQSSNERVMYGYEQLRLHSTTT